MVLACPYYGDRSFTDELRLKCDRNEPCSNCVARGFDCVYGSYARGRRPTEGQEANRQLDARIRHLEQLINSMAARGLRNSEDSSLQGDRRHAAANSSDGGDATHQDTSNDPSNGVLEYEPGRIVSSNNQMTYVSSTHWASVCNEVRDTDTP